MRNDFGLEILVMTSALKAENDIIYYRKKGTPYDLVSIPTDEDDESAL
jgi:hypothetical protein